MAINMGKCYAKSISDMNLAIQNLNWCDSTNFGEVMAKIRFLGHFLMYKWPKFVGTLNGVVENSFLCP